MPFKKLLRAQIFLQIFVHAADPVTENDRDVQQFSYACILNTDSTTCLKNCEFDDICFGYTLNKNKRCCLKYYYSPGEEVSLGGSKMWLKGRDPFKLTSVFWKQGWVSQFKAGLSNTVGWSTVKYNNVSLDLDSELSDIVLIQDDQSSATLNGFKSTFVNSLVTSGNSRSSVYIKTILSYLYIRIATPGMTLSSIEKIAATQTVSIYSCMVSCVSNTICTTIAFEFSSGKCDLLKAAAGKSYSLSGFNNAFGIQRELIKFGALLDKAYTGSPYSVKYSRFSDCYNVCFNDFICNFSSYDGVIGKCSLYTTVNSIVVSQGHSSWKITTTRTKSETFVSTKNRETSQISISTSTSKDLKSSRIFSSFTSSLVNPSTVFISTLKFTESKHSQETLSYSISNPSKLKYQSDTTAILNTIDLDTYIESTYDNLSMSNSNLIEVPRNTSIVFNQQETQVANTSGSGFAGIGIIESIGIFLLVILCILACLKCTTFFYDRSKKQRMERVQSRDLMHSKSSMGMARSTSSGFDIPLQPIKTKKQSPLRVDTTPKRRF